MSVELMDTQESKSLFMVKFVSLGNLTTSNSSTPGDGGANLNDGSDNPDGEDTLGNPNIGTDGTPVVSPDELCTAKIL